MTTKSKKSPAKKAVSKAKTTAKKAVRKATGTAKKKSTVRHRASTRRKASEKSKPAEKRVSAPLFSLFDQASGFIDQAVTEVDKATAHERQAIRDNILSFIDNTSKRLMKAIDDDSAPSRRR